VSCTGVRCGYASHTLSEWFFAVLRALPFVPFAARAKNPPFAGKIPFGTTI
jgi:hypothetical protein